VKAVAIGARADHHKRCRASRNTDLFVFLTPRIVRDNEGQDATTKNVQRNGGALGNAVRRTPSASSRGRRKVP
jgi:type II secretory pathway component GspD/PulD (secretin)